MKRRNTPAKEAILKVLSDRGKAMSQDGIEQHLKIGVDRATIYRTLNRFCEDGVLHRLLPKMGSSILPFVQIANKRGHRDLIFISAAWAVKRSSA